MKVKLTLFAVALVATSAMLTVGTSVATADDSKAFSATCVVSGKPAKESSVVDYNGKKVYFCCAGCPAKFEKNPEDYTANVNLQLLETGQMLQVACPFTGKPVNEKMTVEVGTTKVGFCCGGCKAKAEKASADALVSMVFGDISKGFTLQTMCPVGNKPVDLTKSIEYDGQTVYFCCPGCAKKFKADPAKYVAKLPQFVSKK